MKLTNHQDRQQAAQRLLCAARSRRSHSVSRASHEPLGRAAGEDFAAGPDVEQGRDNAPAGQTADDLAVRRLQQGAAIGEPLMTRSREGPPQNRQRLEQVRRRQVGVVGLVHALSLCAGVFRRCLTAGGGRDRACSRRAFATATSMGSTCSPTFNASSTMASTRPSSVASFAGHPRSDPQDDLDRPSQHGLGALGRKVSGRSEECNRCVNM